MTTYRRTCLGIAILGLVACALFPPWMRAASGGSTIAGMHFAASGPQFAGYSFLLSPTGAYIDFSRLAVEFLIVAAIAGACLLFERNG